MCSHIITTKRKHSTNPEILKYPELIVVDKRNLDAVQCGYFLAQFAGEYDKEPSARERHFGPDNDSAMRSGTVIASLYNDRMASLSQTCNT
jgi:hypothetical protein